MSVRKPTSINANAVAPTTVGASIPESSTPSNVSTPMRFTKRFNVQITGTMANFEAEGPSIAQWRPVEGQHVKIFTNASAEMDLGSAMKVLQSTWLVNARILEHKNSFPVPLGVNVSCIKGPRAGARRHRRGIHVHRAAHDTQPHAVGDIRGGCVCADQPGMETDVR